MVVKNLVIFSVELLRSSGSRELYLPTPSCASLARGCTKSRLRAGSFFLTTFVTVKLINKNNMKLQKKH